MHSLWRFIFVTILKEETHQGHGASGKDVTNMINQRSPAPPFEVCPPKSRIPTVQWLRLMSKAWTVNPPTGGDPPFLALFLTTTVWQLDTNLHLCPPARASLFEGSIPPFVIRPKALQSSEQRLALRCCVLDVTTSLSWSLLSTEDWLTHLGEVSWPSQACVTIRWLLWGLAHTRHRRSSQRVTQRVTQRLTQRVTQLSHHCRRAH